MRREHFRSLATILAVAFFLVAVYFPALAKMPEEPSPALRAVVEAERAFAQQSVEKGMRDAFLANFAEDSVVFRPGPVPALAWFRGRPPVKGTLSWEPDFAGVSAGGDFGYTSGPWQYREPGAEPAGHGHFVSIWRRQVDGTFKVELDTGISHDAPTGAVSLAYARPTETTRAAAPAAVDATREQDALLALDRAAAHEATAKSWSDVWLGHAAADVRLYRSGAFPAIGKDAARAALATRAGTSTWTPLAARVARVGDLGYTYGTMEFHPAGTATDSVEAAAYLRIWRKRDDGGREIVVDVASPMPPPTRAPKP